VVLVTGGGGGLGRVVGRTLAEAGASVALLGRSRAPLERASASIGAHVVVADVTDRRAVESAVAEVRDALGPVTWLVNAAGIALSAPPLPPDDEVWERTLAVNTTGAWITSTAVLPDMVAGSGGAIVNVASTAALRGFRYTAAYVASKHALLGLTRALALDGARWGVRVSAVCPGFLDTEMTARTVARIAETTGRSEDEARATIAALNASGRLVPPAEVAGTVLDLLRDESRSGEAVTIE